MWGDESSIRRNNWYSPNGCGRICHDAGKAQKLAPWPHECCRKATFTNDIIRSGFDLDDFGTGAASFGYLNSFDINTVQFDGPVVKRASAIGKGKAFLASMATLCNEAGVETITEMVKDKELANFLLGCGFYLSQGWYFRKPIPDPNDYKSH